jgi:hypothetical protein
MIWSYFKRVVASLRRIGGIELPDDGRSSVESTLSGRMGAMLDAFDGVSPVIDFELLRCIELFSIHNPDFSQYVANIINLGNTGHQVTVEAKDSGRAEAALARINDAAQRLYPNGAGVDGLINAYLRQIAVFGALSSEDVVDLRARRVDQVVIVPVKQIRFRYLDGRYVPHQKIPLGAARPGASFGLNPLHPETYRYFALSTLENSPYAIPPGSAAVSAITGPQTDMLDNIKYIAKKLGILGLVSVACTPPPKLPNEDQDKYNTRAQNYLRSVRKVFDNNFVKGLLVHFRDQKIDHTNVASDARGAYEIWRIVEEQVMSGLAMPPAFFGRTDSTTETYAGVVYNLLSSQVGNIQRLAKRRQEATYRLDLRLGGIEVDGISLSFNRSHALKPLEEAQAEEIRVRTALTKARAGITSPDEAAQEMGYDHAFDPELLSSLPEAASSLRAMLVGAGHVRESMTATFHFNRSTGRYKFVPQVIELNGAPVEMETYVPVRKFVSVKKKLAA